MSTRDEFDRNGFVVLPEFLSGPEIARAMRELPKVFPTSAEFHDDVDPACNERFRSEFGGITNFPFESVELSLLSVHPRLIALAEELLATTSLRAYSIEAWAKFTGAASYEQEMHRDYLNHSLLVPDPGAPAAQVEMFVYLSDVDESSGPPAYINIGATRLLPSLPNWLPRERRPAHAEHHAWTSADAWPELYDSEVKAVGRAGTVVAYRIDTFHRGTEMTAPRGARYTIHTNFRRADADWITRRAWTEAANTDAWHAFVASASVRQLEVFGFPPPGHDYWSDATLAGLAQRYPGFDPEPWGSAAGAGGSPR